MGVLPAVFWKLPLQQAAQQSATVTPCVKADTLMRARMAGVMSSVRRAV
jgi:hypothetical protein